MNIVKFIEEKFWLAFIIAMVAGLLAPAFGRPLNFLVIPFLMIVLFLTYLKTDFKDIISHIKKPVFLTYILLMFLLVIPAVVFGIFKFISTELAIGFLLLCSMPAGVASPVFANIVKGNTSLAIVITLISHLIAPFTVPLLFFIFTQKILPIDLVSLSKTLLLLAFIPFISAQILKKTKPKFIEETKPWYGFINIFFISLLVYTIFAIQANEIFKNPVSIFLNILWAYALFMLLHVGGYLVAFWRNKEDKIALSVSKTYMNTSLALGLSLAFFTPQIALIVVLAEIPWTTTLGPFKYFLKYLK